MLIYELLYKKELKYFNWKKILKFVVIAQN